MRSSPAPWQKALSFLPVTLIFLYLVGTGLWGIDFGHHWDEGTQFILMEQTIKTGVLLPNWYKYPSVTYGLSLAGLLRHILAAAPRAGGDWHVVQDHLLLVIQTPAFLLQVRSIFLVVSALAVLWVFLQAAADRRFWLEGLVAAACLGFSWELAYHSRWIAPDAVMMQFGALVLLFVTWMVRLPDRRWPRWGAAIAAGFATGTKYPGGLLILPVLIAAWQVQPRRHLWLRLGQVLVGVLPLFLLAYLYTTPGTVLDPINFIKSVTYEMGHYGSGRYDQTVTPGLAHLGLMLVYLGGVLFSHYMPIAVAFFLLAILGAAAVFRSSRSQAWLLLSFPLVYLLYFSTQRVMAARNVLVLAPFLAVLAGRGAGMIAAWLPRRSLQLAWGGLLAVLLAVNAAWLATAADSIHAGSPERFGTELISYIQSHPGVKFAVSTRVWESLKTLPAALPVNLVPLPASGESQVAFYASEGMKDPLAWPSNWPGLTERYFGPWEVNFDYYPLWNGEDRILLMSIDQARKIGIEVVK